MKASFFLIFVLAAAPLAAQSDPEHPLALLNNVLENTTHGEGGNTYYQFPAGPGELKISVQASTDYYSSPVEVEVLTSDGKSIGSINLVATDTVGRSSRTFRFASRDDVVMKVATNSDSHVKWLKYRIALKGAVELQAPGMPSTSAAPPPADPAIIVDPATSANAPTASEAAPPPATVDVQTTSNAAFTALAQTLGSLTAMPSQAALRIDMKDGTFRLIPLSGVLRLSVVKSK